MMIWATMDNQSLLNQLKLSGVLRSENLIKAFFLVDRADFVLPETLEFAYEDRPLPIGFGQTISQPYTVAFMLELLEPGLGEKILDIGSGSGWTTALLAASTGKTGKVFGVEKILELVKFGQSNLAKYNFAQASIRVAEGELGLSKKSPFDKILVSAAALSLPVALVGQLRVGGALVIPIQSSVFKIIKLDKQKTQTQEFPGFAFVPLV